MAHALPASGLQRENFSIDSPISLQIRQVGRLERAHRENRRAQMRGPAARRQGDGQSPGSNAPVAIGVSPAVMPRRGRLRGAVLLILDEAVMHSRHERLRPVRGA